MPALLERYTCCTLLFPCLGLRVICGKCRQGPALFYGSSGFKGVWFGDLCQEGLVGQLHPS